jgi:hypothetical protein
MRCELAHHHVVIDAIEELLEVDIHDDATARRDEALRGHDGHVRAAPRAKPVAVFRERRIESGLEHLQDGLLDEAVDHRRDAELSRTPSGLRDLSTKHGHRLICPGH